MKQTDFGRAFLFLLLFVPLGIQTSHAQNSSTSATQGNQSPKETAPKEGSNSTVYTSRDIYVPKVPEEKGPEPTATSFADGFLRNTRQHVGGSIGVFESYTPNVLASETGKEGLSVLSIAPQIYFNVQKKKLEFRLTYGVTSTRYNKNLSDLNRVSQSGTAAFSYGVTRRKTTLQLSTFISSMYYDASSALASSLMNPYQFGPTAQIYLDRRRESRETTFLNVNRAITKKGSIGITLNHDVSRYSAPEIPRRNVLSAGVGGSYEVKKWLNLTTQYNHYLNDVDPRFRNSNIESLQVGGLSIKPGPGWVISFSGGVDSTKASGSRVTVGSGQAGISKRSRRSTIDFGYHRGYTSIFPSAEVWYGDTASLHFVEFITRQLNLRGDAYSIRSSSIKTTSITNTTYGSGALDFAAINNLVFTASYFLISQKVTDLRIPGANFHRNTMTVGVNYYLRSPGEKRP